MSDVVIIEAVRSPIGRRNGGLSTVHPGDLLSHVLNEVVSRSGIDPAEVGQVVAGCVSQVGEQSFNLGRTAWLAAGLPLEVAADDGRHPVRFVPAGHQPRHGARRGRSGRRGDRVWRRVDESRPDRFELVEEAGSRGPHPEGLLRQVRVHLPVRGSGAHRREVGRDPQGLRRVRCRLPAARRRRVGRRSIRHPGGTGRRSRRRRRGEAHRVDPPRRPRRGPPRHVARGARRHSSRSAARTACTRPARRRRSPTEPPRC